MAADPAGAVSSWRRAREAAININTAAPPTRCKPDTQTKFRSPREPHLFGFTVKIIQHECNKSSRAEPQRPPSSSSPPKSNTASRSAARLLSNVEIFEPFNAKTVFFTLLVMSQRAWTPLLSGHKPQPSVGSALSLRLFWQKAVNRGLNIVFFFFWIMSYELSVWMKKNNSILTMW